jgi:hypothetical protein
MASSGYTIRFFVADGDPEGLRVIDQMNWTGTGIVFPRSLWSKVKTRKEFDRAGVYILVGYSEEDEDLPRVYVGEGDGIRARIERHDQQKDFWTSCICFTSTSAALNKAHVQWLEYSLVKLALESEQCTLDNGNAPQAPALSEHEEADVAGFLEHMLRILPLVNLRAFEKPKPVASVGPAATPSIPAKGHEVMDTVIVPAQKEGFERVFLGQNQWHAIRIGGAKLEHIKYCAAYQTNPVSAVTHVAPVKQIEPYGDSGKYRLIFAAPATEIGPIPFGDAASGTMQGPRYTQYSRLATARKVGELF